MCRKKASTKKDTVFGSPLLLLHLHHHIPSIPRLYPAYSTFAQRQVLKISAVLVAKLGRKGVDFVRGKSGDIAAAYISSYRRSMQNPWHKVSPDKGPPCTNLTRKEAMSSGSG